MPASWLAVPDRSSLTALRRDGILLKYRHKFTAVAAIVGVRQFYRYAARQNADSFDVKHGVGRT